VEGTRVAEAKGIDVDALDRFEEFCEFLGEMDHRTSMLQDVEAGRRTEIGELNEALVELAEEEDVDVPYNRLLTALIRGLERSYLDDE